MAHTIRLNVHASLRDADLARRILDFKEDVHRELLRSRLGIIEEPAAMNQALAPVTIVVARKRHYSRLAPFVAAALLRYGVTHAVRVTEEHS